MELIIGCNFPNGPKGQRDYFQAPVHLPRIHAVLLASVIKSGGTPEAAFCLGNTEAFSPAEQDFFDDTEKHYIKNEYPIWLPSKRICTAAYADPNNLTVTPSRYDILTLRGSFRGTVVADAFDLILSPNRTEQQFKDLLRRAWNGT